jgi:aspartate/methionine/tyrosine aminotransferase
MTVPVSLFASLPVARNFVLPREALAAAAEVPQANSARFRPDVDDRLLEVFARANDPTDPFELRDLWLGRVEQELGAHSHRPWLAERWRATAPRRTPDTHEILSSRATVRFVKEMFNWFFRDDVYGELRSDDHLILSSGAVDEVAWGLPEALKECIRYALARDWYGYSDSRGRAPAREAIAAYETTRIDGASYTADNVAVSMGGTFAISTLVDFVFLGAPACNAPALCAIPNYPPLVESVARRHSVELVPLASQAGETDLEPLIAALRPNTPLVLLQTAANPTGAGVAERELERLIRTASPSTMIVLDECHEWLGPSTRCSTARAARNVIRVSSLSKKWSAPGLKIGWILADAPLIAEYYEYASTTFGGPPSFFYTLVELHARMERWRALNRTTLGPGEAAELSTMYHTGIGRLQAAYDSYCDERERRETALVVLRAASITGLARAGGHAVPTRYSINLAVEFPDWSDSYLCFRDLLRETGVAVFPGLLTFCFSGSPVRITTARQWSTLSAALARLQGRAAQSRARAPHATTRGLYVPIQQPTVAATVR